MPSSQTEYLEAEYLGHMLTSSYAQKLKLYPGWGPLGDQNSRIVSDL